MLGWDLLERVVILLAAALAAGTVFRRVRQHPIVGYLLVGFLLGPGGVALLRNTDQIRSLSELGVSLLLFSIGLEFSPHRLREIGRVATVGGTVQIIATTAAVSVVCLQFQYSWREAVLIGLAVSMSSTAVVLRVLAERSQLDSQHGRNALGLLLLQDLAVIPSLLAIELMTTSHATVLVAFGAKLAAVALFIVLLVLMARHVAPKAMVSVAAAETRELPVILAAVFSLGAAWGAHALGLSPALGAFAAGLLLAESRFAEQIRADIAPFTHIFVTIFFASVGTMVVVPWGWSIARVAGTALALLVLKSVVVGTVIWFFQRSLRVALSTGLVLSQVGEFTFVLAGAGLREGILSNAHFEFLLAVAMVTLMSTPVLISSAPAISTLLLRSIPHRPRRVLEERHSAHHKDRILVIGYGPAGRQVVERLVAAGEHVLVLDMNAEIARVVESPVELKFGDATQSEILQHAGAAHARAVVITLPDPENVRLIVAQLKRLAPVVPVVVRSRYHRFAERLLRAGADRIVDEELAVGQRLADETLQRVTKSTSSERNAEFIRQ